MSKFSLPYKKAYVKGDNVTVSLRIPESLKLEIEKQAKQLGRGFSEHVSEGLDQYAKFIRTALDSEK